MRLTLRTLLAYLDDILDPADKEELAKKVESSDFAAELIHRTRDTTRRLRLSAPQVMGTGMGLDPNTVAEYLDNVLPPDSVGDFERICLESDMHLAEVASCHHVLTMVLGEPADVDPTARHRMYEIPNGAPGQRQVRVEPAHVPASVPAPAPVAVAAAAPVASPVMQNPAVSQSVSMEIPDYLRASGWTRYRGAIIGLAALLLVAAVVLFVPGVRGLFGGAAPTNSVAGNGNRSGTATDNTAQATLKDAGVDSKIGEPSQTGPVMPPSTTTTAPPFSGTSVTSPPAVTGQVPSAIEQATMPESTGAGALTGNPAMPNQTPGTNNVGAGAPVMPAHAQPTQPTQQAANDVMPTTGGAGAMPAMTGDSGPATGGIETGSNIAMTQATPLPAMPAAPVGPGPGTTASIPNMGDATPLTPPQVVNLGTYLGGKTVLLRYIDKQQSWFRVEPRAAVLIGDRLLALPEFRPRISLASGISMDMSGGTLASMKTADLVTVQGLPAGDSHVAAIELVYGRIVLINTAPEEQRLRLTTGPTTADVRLARNATLGVQVTRAYVPGADPRKMPSPVLTEFIAPAGGVVWMDAAGERPIMDGSRWTIVDGMASPPSPLLKPVEWLDHEPAARASEQLAVTPIEIALSIDRPVDEQLLATYDGSKKREVKSLAARCGMHVGMFVPFIQALRDSDQKTSWRSHIDTLRAAMALNPASAEQVWQTLVKERDLRAATDLYEMLCGYSMDQVGRTPEQRRNPAGPLARLIGWLTSDNLDYRVLAVENLWEITGKRLMPNPAGSQTERASGIRDWTKRLAADELVSPAAAAQQ